MSKRDKLFELLTAKLAEIGILHKNGIFTCTLCGEKWRDLTLVLAVAHARDCKGKP